MEGINHQFASLMSVIPRKSRCIQGGSRQSFETSRHHDCVNYIKIFSKYSKQKFRDEREKISARKNSPRNERKNAHIKQIKIHITDIQRKQVSYNFKNKSYRKENIRLLYWYLHVLLNIFTRYIYTILSRDSD